MEAKGGVLDMRPNQRKLYLGGTVKIVPDEKTTVLQLYAAPSGHLILPTSNFAAVEREGAKCFTSTFDSKETAGGRALLPTPVTAQVDVGTTMGENVVQTASLPMEPRDATIVDVPTCAGEDPGVSGLTARVNEQRRKAMPSGDKTGRVLHTLHPVNAVGDV